jgi:hypothetical protein
MCSLDEELSKLEEIYASRQTSLLALKEKNDLSQITEISKQEKAADASLAMIKSLIDDFNKNQKPREKAACKKQIERYSEIRNSFYWTMFPIQIASLDGIKFSRDELMTHYKEISSNNESFKKSLHPFCLSLYSAYDKACRQCAKDLGIPILKPDSHEFRIGDLSILFYYMKKKMLLLNSTNACEVVDSIITSVHSLLTCLAKRVVYNDKCVAPSSKTEHKEEMQYGDKNHFQWIQFLCFELLSFFEAIDAVLVKHDCLPSKEYNEVCELYSETFQTCETTVRQHLGMKYKDQFSFSSYKDWIKGSVLYAQLTQEASKTYTRKKEMLLQYMSFIHNIQALKDGKVTLHVFLLTMSQFDALGEQVRHLGNLTQEKYRSAVKVRDYSFMVFLTEEQIWKHEYLIKSKYEEFKKKQLDVKAYADFERLYVVDALLQEVKKQIPKQIVSEISIEIQKALLDDFNNYVKERTVTVLSVCETIELFLQSLIAKLNIEVNEEASQLKEEWDFDEQVSKTIAKVKSEKDFNNIMLDFLANKFSPLNATERKFTYNYMEHMNMLNDMLKAKEMRVCKHIIHKPAWQTLKQKSSVRKSKNNSAYNTTSQYQKLSHI